VQFIDKALGVAGSAKSQQEHQMLPVKTGQ
jgi:hypothetical protein